VKQTLAQMIRKNAFLKFEHAFFSALNLTNLDENMIILTVVEGFAPPERLECVEMVSAGA
jgi:hypothetical protein